MCSFALTKTPRKFCIKPAFTLAEVLITLAIIGVVAAMTIPSVLDHYKKQEATSRIKKFYGEMTQAIILSELENGASEFWTMPSSNNTTSIKNYFNTYLGAYFKYLKIEDNPESNNNIFIYLNDGTRITLQRAGCMDFMFDINGEAKPNTLGRDIFNFAICPNNALGAWQFSNEKFIATCGSVCKTREGALERCKNTPMYCSGILFHDNWQFKKDYPFKI